MTSQRRPYDRKPATLSNLSDPDGALARVARSRKVAARVQAPACVKEQAEPRASTTSERPVFRASLEAEDGVGLHPISCELLLSYLASHRP